MTSPPLLARCLRPIRADLWAFDLEMANHHVSQKHIRLWMDPTTSISEEKSPREEEEEERRKEEFASEFLKAETEREKLREDVESIQKLANTEEFVLPPMRFRFNSSPSPTSELPILNLDDVTPFIMNLPPFPTLESRVEPALNQHFNDLPQDLALFRVEGLPFLNDDSVQHFYRELCREWKPLNVNYAFFDIFQGLHSSDDIERYLTEMEKVEMKSNYNDNESVVATLIPSNNKNIIELRNRDNDRNESYIVNNTMKLQDVRPRQSPSKTSISNDNEGGGGGESIDETINVNSEEEQPIRPSSQDIKNANKELKKETDTNNNEEDGHIFKQSLSKIALSNNKKYVRFQYRGVIKYQSYDPTNELQSEVVTVLSPVCNNKNGQNSSEEPEVVSKVTKQKKRKIKKTTVSVPSSV